MINKNFYNILVISLLILLSCVFLDSEAHELLERRRLQEEIDFLTALHPPTFQEYTPSEGVWGEEQEVKEEVEVKRLNLNYLLPILAFTAISLVKYLIAK